MNPEDIICLILILVGAILIVRSFVHRHKGMWNLKDDNYSEPWDPVNPKLPPNLHRRGSINSPYQETQAGVIFIAMGVLFAIQLAFGLRVFAVALIVFCAAYIIYNVIMLRRFDEDDDDLRITRTVNFILSGCAAGFGFLLLILV